MFNKIFNQLVAPFKVEVNDEVVGYFYTRADANLAARMVVAVHPFVKVMVKNHTHALRQAKAKPFIATSIATGKEYFCQSLVCDQARALELNPSDASKCLRGKFKQHKGFTFRYA